MSRTIHDLSVWNKPLIAHVNIVRLAEPIRRCVRWWTQIFKIEGLVCKRFLPSPPPPPLSVLALVSSLARPRPRIPFFPQPRSQGSLLPNLSRSVGRVGENPGNEVVLSSETERKRLRRRLRFVLSSNCCVFCVLSTATWDSEKQDVSFPHHFEGFPLKKRNAQVKKGIGLCCSDFYSFWWCYKLLFSCHKTRRLQTPFECRIIKLRKKLNIVWQSQYFLRCYKISWLQHILVDLK